MDEAGSGSGAGSFAVWTAFARGKLLSGMVFAALELVCAFWTDANVGLPVVLVGMTEEPPADKDKHEGYRRCEDSER